MGLWMPTQAIMADECNCDCVSELRSQISVTYPDDYIILVMDNAV
ncbi:hypothetical protein ACTGW9_04340 [Streptococcus suis]